MRRFLFVISLAVLTVTGSAAEAGAPMIHIKDGRVIDGSGEPARKADVLISGDRIVQVGRVELEPGARVTTIDARGKVVTPGFIDSHAHGDPCETPEFHNFLAMGVTTVCFGQDGESSKTCEFGRWIQEVEEIRPGVNIVSLIGHGTVRHESGIGYYTTASLQQLEGMADLVDKAMEAGAFGLSSGIEYTPGIYADARELAACAVPVGKRGGVIHSHIRSEDDDRIEAALEEFFNQGRAGKCHVNVSHLKCVYARGAARAEELLAVMEHARNSGIEVTADLYPYTASHTGIGIVFPTFAKPPNDYEQVRKERREELRNYLVERVTKRNGPGATLFTSGKYTGKTLEQVADEEGRHFADVLIDLGPESVSGAYFVMDEELQARLLKDTHVSVCSDGSPTMRHPRGYGSFAKIIRKFVREDKLLTLEEAVWKMTGLTAKNLSLLKHKRGLVREGFAADVLVFDPEKVRDKADFQSPHQLSEGFDWIVVNGELVREDGKFSGTRAGHAIRGEW